MRVLRAHDPVQASLLFLQHRKILTENLLYNKQRHVYIYTTYIMEIIMMILLYIGQVHHQQMVYLTTVHWSGTPPTNVCHHTATLPLVNDVERINWCRRKFVRFLL